MRRYVIVAVGLAATAALAGGAYLSGEIPGTPPSTLSLAKAVVRRNMRDPQSTQFQGLFVAKHSKTVCGNFNSKNSYGAYPGFRGFAVAEGQLFSADHLDVISQMRAYTDAMEADDYDAWKRLRKQDAEWCAYSKAISDCASEPPITLSAVQAACKDLDESADRTFSIIVRY